MAGERRWFGEGPVGVERWGEGKKMRELRTGWWRGEPMGRGSSERVSEVVRGWGRGVKGEFVRG